MDSCRDRVINQKQKLDRVVMSMSQHTLHRLLFNQRSGTLLNQRETKNTCKQQENNKQFFDNRSSREITVAYCRDRSGCEIPRGDIDSTIVTEFKVASINPIYGIGLY